VKIDLIVRGLCCLRPGIPGVSENITVRSIVGRLLEHNRLYYFENSGNEEIYMGSADLMPRNLDHRVELLFPILNTAIVRRLRDTVLKTCLSDNVKARIGRPDGGYEFAPVNGEGAFDSQGWFIKNRVQAD
jgi:polyphosphate kinase